jgi:hypothetical protein
MHALWHWVLYVLAWASHDPATLAAERARAAGCVTVAYASLATEPAKEPAAEPAKPVAPARCRECDGTGKIFRPDGGYVRCKCGACPSGTCRKNLP